MKKLFPILMLALILTGLVHQAAQADGGPTPTADEVNAIARQLFCPVCENTPLDVCETEACAQWREVIREKLAAGWTEDEIKQYFVDYYGARVLSEPPREGFNWLAYIVPPVLIALGLLLLVRTFIRWKRRAPQPAAAGAETASAVTETAAEDDEYLSRLEEALRKRQ